jgi:type II secretory pathway predicted ATPase ExeA
MYETHFGLRRRPFRPIPDSDAYYPATTHERALEHLRQAIDHDEGPVLLMGDPGTGKTLLSHCLLDRLGPEASSAVIANTHFTDRSDLFQALLGELGLKCPDCREQTMRLAVTDAILESFKAGKRTLLVIDEAHHLDADLLEELRLLGNLEARTGKAVQVMLIAQPAILSRLASPDLTALRQRIAVRASLDPLGPDESADYLVHLLRSAGGRPEAIIADEALAILANGCQGIPRVLNQAAHQSLLLAHSAEVAPVDAEVALEALQLLGLEMHEEAVSCQSDSSGGKPAQPAASSRPAPWIQGPNTRRPA